MWDRFTERARRVIYFAQGEATKLGEATIDTEHLLLGLVRENDSVAAKILDRLSAPVDRVRAEVELLTVNRIPASGGQDMQLAPHAKRAIDLAYNEARRLDNNYIGTEHLLLGLVADTEGLAGGVLRNLGLDLVRVLRAVQALEPREMGQVPSAPDRPALRNAVRPSVGDLGVLRNPHGREQVEVAIDVTAYASLIATYQALDHHGYLQLADRGRMFIAPTGTEAKLLQNPRDNNPNVTDSAWYVRILNGEHTGRAGWIVRHDFERIGPDTSPFPPPPP